MPTCFDIVASAGSYPVTIDPGCLDRVLAEDGDRIFIVDSFFAARVAAAGIDPIVIVADEPAKSLERMTGVIVEMRERRATRSTRLIAIGGGVVQDIAAFAASVYMRGIDWTYVPTTMLSMTDSCIGGKSSINVGKYKNIVGTIHPPVEVLIDPEVARTLSAEQKAEGLAEAVKICMCRGGEAFDRYMALAPDTAADADRLAEVIDLTLRTKKWFIEIDEFDRGERLLLNFGHTFGHALESASDFAVSHGIAVGLGMIAALELGAAMGRHYGEATAAGRLRAYVDGLVRPAPGLDRILAAIETSALMDAFQSDKKHSREHFAAIVVTEESQVERIRLPRDAATSMLIERAFAAMLDQYRVTSAAAA